MSLWNKAAREFEENSHNGQYFETQSITRALKQIHGNIEQHSPQMLFLLGEPGSGKTFLLNHLCREYKKQRYCLLIENPFLTPVELLRRMLAFAHVEYDGMDVEAMRLLAIEAYKDTPHIIMIDEAQLASSSLLEFIRILSDSKAFWFLIAMHKKEGENLLKSPHFYSRPHAVVYMGELKKEESLPFLKKVLHTPELLTLIASLDENLINKSWDLSNGNFRSFKKIYYNLFLLLDHAATNDNIKFISPNQQLFEMAAIKAGLEISRTSWTKKENLLPKMPKMPKPPKKFFKFLKILIGILVFLIISFLSFKWIFGGADEAEKKVEKKIEKKVEKKPIIKTEKKQVQEENTQKLQVIKPLEPINETPKPQPKPKETKKVEKRAEPKSVEQQTKQEQVTKAQPKKEQIKENKIQELQLEKPAKKFQYKEPKVLEFYPPSETKKKKKELKVLI